MHFRWRDSLDLKQRDAARVQPSPQGDLLAFRQLLSRLFELEAQEVTVPLEHAVDISRFDTARDASTEKVESYTPLLTNLRDDDVVEAHFTFTSSESTLFSVV